jgi:hypothetical protein
MADSPEIVAEQVEEFAQAARQMIDDRLLRALGGERFDFWGVVAMIYARGLAKEPAAVEQDRPELTALV